MGIPGSYSFPEDRQGDGGSLLTTVISLGLKYGPTLFNLAFGGEGGSSVPDKSTDKIDELEIKVSQFVFFFLPLFAFFSVFLSKTLFLLVK